MLSLLLFTFILGQELEPRVDRLECLQSGGNWTTLCACPTGQEFEVGTGCKDIPEPPPPPPPDLNSGTWISIPGSEMRSIFDPTIDDRWPTLPGAFEKVQFAWSGGTCAGNELVLWGGGHGNGPHNGVFAVDVQTGVWRRITLPAFPVREAPSNGPTNPDGTPVARHTYDTLVSDGQSLYAVGGSVWSSGKIGDPPRAWRLDLLTGAWAPFGDERQPLAIAGSLKLVDGKLYLGNSAGFGVFDPSVGTWERLFEKQMNHTTDMEYSPLTDSFYGVGATGRLWAVSRENLLVNPRTNPNETDFHELPDFFVPETATIPAFNVTEMTHPGSAWYPPTGEILYWNGGSQLIALDVVNETWRIVSLAGDPGPEKTQGTMGRFDYCGGRLVLVNGVDEPLWYVNFNEPEPEPEPEPLPNEAVLAPYYETPPGDALVDTQCGPQSEWEVFDVRTDEEAVNVRGMIKEGMRAVFKVHWKPTPFPSIVIKDGRTEAPNCIRVTGIPGPNGEKPLVASLNATRSWRFGDPVLPGGVIFDNLRVSAGESGEYGLKVADCVGVPNRRMFLILRDLDVSACGHHSFITGHGHHFYLEIGRSTFEQADSHLAYIHHIAMAYIYDSTFQSPGWGHALRCVALRCVIERVKVSNIQLDGTTLVTGEQWNQKRTFIGMHPLEIYTCGNHDISDIEVVYRPERGRNGDFVANYRQRESFQTCDVGEVVNGQWTYLPYDAPEFFNPQRWATVTPFHANVTRMRVTCIGDQCDGLAAWSIATSYPFMTDPEKAALQSWLRENTFEDWEAMRAASTANPTWRWLADQVVTSHRSSFLRGSITNKVPLPVPLPGWFQRANLRLENIHILGQVEREDREVSTYCLGEPVQNTEAPDWANEECVEQFDGRSFRRAHVEVLP